MDKGNIIFEFLKYLNKNGEMVFAQICDIQDFADTDGELIDLIKKHDLIRSKSGEFTYDANVYITENGRNVLEFGSWNNFIKSIKIKTEKENNRQELQDEIDRLTKKNLLLQNKQMKRYVLYSIIAFVFGAIVTNIKDILQLLKILPLE